MLILRTLQGKKNIINRLHANYREVFKENI